MTKPPLTNHRIALALAIAVVADAIQFPITGLTATGIFAIPGEIADFLVDCSVMAAAVYLLGFHWMLLPSIFVELIPGLDLIPTWTGCVAFVIWRRMKDKAAPPLPMKATPPPLPVIDVQEVRPVPPPLSAHASTSAEARLAKLDDLLARKIITPSEYAAKRQRILDEI